jgi:hypothetical protein
MSQSERIAHIAVVDSCYWQAAVLASHITDNKRLTALKYLIHLAGEHSAFVVG